MSATQRAEKLFSMPPLGGRRPSDLLAAMYEYCPAGEEKSQLFKALFLTRLPPEIRVLLEPEEFADLKQLATRADQLWLTLAARQFAATAAMQPDALVSEEDPDTVAAVAGKRQRFQRRKQKPADAHSSAGGPSTAASGQVAGSATGGSGKQSVALTICWKHAGLAAKLTAARMPARASGWKTSRPARGCGSRRRWPTKPSPLPHRCSFW
jgi:hypothetical protein